MQHLPQLTVADRGTTAPFHESSNIPAPFQSPHSLRKHCPGQQKAVVSSGSLYADLNLMFTSKHVKLYTSFYMSICLSICQCSQKHWQKSRCNELVSWKPMRNLPVSTPQALSLARGSSKTTLKVAKKLLHLTSVAFWVTKVLLQLYVYT